MEVNTLIKKVHMDCPLCDKTHEVEERIRYHMRSAFSTVQMEMERRMNLKPDQ